MDQEVINAVIPVFIQTWHQRIGHLGYQNIFWLPKVVDGIDVNGRILGEMCGACMKGRQ